jgi:tetratricopeptide (TPR) repeat protein
LIPSSTVQNHCAEVLAAARPLCERALAIWEKWLGPEHPEIAESLDNLASLLKDQGDLTAAQQLYERAQAIRGDTNLAIKAQNVV